MRDLTYPPVILTAKTLFRAMGLRFQLSGTEHVPRTGGALLAFNHVSYLDFIFGGYGAQPSSGWSGSWQSGKRSTMPSRPGDAVDAPHLRRPCRWRRIDEAGAGVPACR